MHAPQRGGWRLLLHYGLLIPGGTGVVTRTHTQVHRVVIRLAGLATALTCSPVPDGGESRPGGTAVLHHPEARWVDTSIGVGFTIPLDAPGDPGALRLGAGAQGGWGTEADAPEHAIGRIYKVLLLPDRGVVIVDDRSQVVRVYASSGRPQQVVGRAGQGPGEFRRPLSAAIDGRGRLYVSDTNRRIQVFAPSGGEYHYERTLTLEVEAQDMCFLGDNLIVQGLSLARQALIHIFDEDGKLVRSFGALYRSPSPDMNEEFGLGRISCDGKRGLIYYAPRIGIGEVRAFEVSGTPSWRTTFSGFRSNPWVSENRTLTTRLSRNGNHTLITLALVEGHGLLVQWTFRTWQQLMDEDSFGSTVSFLLDPATGEPLALGDGLPLVPAISVARAVAVYEDPVPRFEVRALEPRR